MTIYTSHVTRDTCNYRRTIASEEFDMKLREVVVSHDGWVSRNDKVFNYIQVSLHLSLSCLVVLLFEFKLNLCAARVDNKGQGERKKQRKK